MSVANSYAFTPAFAGYAERTRSSFGRQGAMALIGAHIVDVRPGYCAIAIAPRPEIAQQHGYVHAGIVGGRALVGRVDLEQVLGHGAS